MAFVEKDFQSKFKVWLDLNPPAVSTGYELKVSKGNSLAYDRVARHQVKKLREVKGRGMYHKIADAPFGHSEGFRFHKPKPFDCLFLKGEAYVVVLFYQKGRAKQMFFIDVDDWIKEMQHSSRKSITKERVNEIKTKVSNL